MSNLQHDNVTEWLQACGLEKYTTAFVENDIELDVLGDITDADLREMGLPIGARKRILRAIEATLASTDSARSKNTDGSAAVRRQLTVLFCDLADSTVMAEQLDPESVSTINRQYQTTTATEIERFGGYVARYMGDGILAYFGYPIAHEDDAERAALCGLSIVESIKTLTTSIEPAVPLRVRVGIATGVVVVGEKVGDGASQEATAVGATPNLAARLQSVAGYNEIVVSDQTQTLLGNKFLTSPLQDLSLKGISEPVNAWRIEERSGSQTRFGSYDQHDSATWVGRDEEIRKIRSVINDRTTKQNKCVLIRGEAGLGKSTLLAQVANSISQESRILQCSPHHTNTRLYPVLAGCDRILREIMVSPDTGLANKFASALAMSSEEIVGLIEILVSGSTPHSIGSAGPDVRERKTNQLLSEILLSSTDPNQRNTVVFEDCHWSDPTTQELIVFLANRLTSTPGTVILTARPEFSVATLGNKLAETIELDRLDDIQARLLVENATDGAVLDGSVIDNIIHRSNGNPLFLTELTRFTVRRPLADGGDGELPNTLADLLNARLDLLGDSRSIAQAAAVIGRDFDLSVLEAATALDSAVLGKHLEILLASDLVQSTSNAQPNSFSFRHALIRDAAYSSLLRETRKTIHHRVADHIESCGDSDGASSGLAALHWHGAGDHARSVQKYCIAGDFAIEAGATVEGTGYFKRAQQIEHEQQSIGVDYKLKTQIRLGLANAMRLTQQHEQSLAVLNEIYEFPAGSVDDASLGTAKFTEGNVYFALGRRNDVLTAHQEALTLARASSDSLLEARSIGGLGDAQYVNGDMAEAANHFKRCCELARSENYTEIEAANSHPIGWSRIFLLEFNEAYDDASRSTELSDRFGYFRSGMLGNLLRGLVLCERNERDDAIPLLDDAFARAMALGATNFAAWSLIIRLRGLNPEDHGSLFQEHSEHAQSLLQEHGGFNFIGPAVLGTRMLITQSTEERCEMIQQAEEGFKAGSVAHNYLFFYECAMEAAWRRNDRDEFERLQSTLSQVDKYQTPWTRFWTSLYSATFPDRRPTSQDADLLSRDQLIDLCRQQQMVRAGKLLV